MDLIFPAGAKINGIWLQPNPAAVGATTAAHHQDFWSLWDWNGWVKPQIDYALEIGVNTFSVIGDLYGVANSTLEQATYRTQHLQIAAYIASKGAYYMPCFANTTPHINYSLTVAEYAALALDVLLSVQAVGNCPGAFVFDEPHASSLTYAFMNDTFTAIKAGGAKVPLSCPETYNQTAWISAIEASMDFYSIGTATFPVPSTLLDTWLSGTDKQVLISTTYKNQTASAGTGGGSAATVVADLLTAYNLGCNGHPRAMGVMQWGCADYGNETLYPGNSASYSWGQYDTNTTPGTFIARQHKTGLIRRFSRGSVVRSLSL